MNGRPLLSARIVDAWNSYEEKAVAVLNNKWIKKLYMKTGFLNVRSMY